MPQRAAIASMSLGRAWVHKLPNKLDQAAKYGFEGIEMFFEDIEYFAFDMFHVNSPSDLTQDNYIDAASAIRTLCNDRGLEIVCLQPFMNYEGLRDREAHARRLEQMKLWLRIAKVLGTTIVQIPSSMLPEEELSGDVDEMVQDLQEVANLGLQESPVIRFAYESLAWGTFVDTWEQCWKIVEMVDRPNFGVCLDTYNIAGRVYADPTAAEGKTPDALSNIMASIERLRNTVNVEKVFFVQVVDAEKLEQPLIEGHQFYNPVQPARMSWSRNCRLFYGEQDRGGYLPVKEIADVFLNGIGFEGWWSMELFNRCMAFEDPGIPEELARRGMESWIKLKRDLHIVDANNDDGDIAPNDIQYDYRLQLKL
ncbi:sugar phosphate isomerase [Rhizodiscina lignyota]|uniref:Sugar phosphate isomerase n=1 Tax=Rhizodiscina lignyota TaxID=1504668 RepID=A0A9P4I9X0_9PEZI|nr:sugar phosphate isomerase [Rhizodiscina lignyota]